MPCSFAETASSIRRNRLLLDIKELTKNPYPNISLHVHDDDLTSACLVLTPEGYKPLHLTMTFDSSYPKVSPRVQMDSQEVSHPNVFSHYICADILKDGDGYTSAYTLKGIAIQMLSFFSSDRVDQDYGGRAVSLQSWRKNDGLDFFKCTKCTFDAVELRTINVRYAHGDDADDAPKESRRARRRRLEAEYAAVTTFAINELPNELLLLVLERLDDFQDLTNFAKVWPRVSHLIIDFDIVRQRELQCFCTKESYQTTKLGVGVSTDFGKLASEFDLLSEEAYQKLEIRNSVHGLKFQVWLPLPLSRRHWEQVKTDAKISLESMKMDLKGVRPSNAQVLYTFMNDIVVRLNEVITDRFDFNTEKSTLRHASEKAIESYFHLFHLLICLATEDPSIVRNANRTLAEFADSKRSKTDCPNLGQLLIALLISDVEVTEKLRKAIITETITRNVVWMLDKRGARRAELSYMEAGPVSAYRLDQTFQSSRTSYRLLMFSELFRRTARPLSNDEKQKQNSLTEVRDELFDRHGAPPRGAAARLAAEVRRLHTINDFPAFLREMGLRNVPTAESFTTLLRQTIHDSMEKGYSKWAFSQEKALNLRLQLERDVPCTPEMRLKAVRAGDGRTSIYDVSFFPGRQDEQRGPGRGGRGGRGNGSVFGRGRGRGRGGRGGRGG
ncbi:putative ubiquitin-conjugating enzyme family protein [Eutypa lata UCREL1]|uniref:Putative ubiquitin-conjugating enzyme family protein n=1 Tax=Eutypa lata (strain UCR-EL1) TaxID=1287681 RepID=M7SYI5_EUTLA|nr:putative ubiquitin-conjugating enzyme family protein [Eutypa lata UCREL1]